MLREGGWAPLLSVGSRLVALGAHVVDAQLLVLLEAALVALHPQLRVLLRGVHVLRGREKPPEPLSPSAWGGGAPDPTNPAPAPSTSCPSEPEYQNLVFQNTKIPSPLSQTQTPLPPSLPPIYQQSSFPMKCLPSLCTPPRYTSPQKTLTANKQGEKSSQAIQNMSGCLSAHHCT